MTLHRSRIVVTGASGFIGRALVARAREARHEVVPLSRSDAGLRGDYEDEAAIAQACAGADAIVHLAARAHRRGNDSDFECNVRAGRSVARAAMAAGVPRLVVVSSIGVNGNVTHGKPFDEDDIPAPVEPYARSKLRCEQQVQAILGDSTTQWTIVRPPLVYGTGAPGNFHTLVSAIARGLPLPIGSVRNQRSLVGIDNLCDALLLCASHPAAAQQVFLVADGDDLSTPDIVRAIARGLGRPTRLWNVPPALLRLGARIAGRPRIAESVCDSLRVDAGKARRMLGWLPAVCPAQGIAQAAAAERTP